jgi:hypothetical protein
LEAVKNVVGHHQVTDVRRIESTAEYDNGFIVI